jgi:hypothetical protein
MQIAAGVFYRRFEASFSVQSRRTCSPGKLANFHGLDSCLIGLPGWPRQEPAACLGAGGRLNSQAREMVPKLRQEMEALIDAAFAQQEAFLIASAMTLSAVPSSSRATAGANSRDKVPLRVASPGKAPTCSMQNLGSHARK